MTIDQIKEVLRVAEEKIAYQLTILEQQTGLHVSSMDALRKECSPDQPVSAFKVSIQMQLRD